MIQDYSGQVVEMIEDYSAQVELLKALAHPTRLQILDILRTEAACVCHLTAVLRKPQPYVSQQIAVLRDAGLVIDDRLGLNVFYQVRDRRVYELVDQLRTMLSSRVPDRGDERARAPIGPVRLAGCPCPKCQRRAA